MNSFLKDLNVTINIHVKNSKIHLKQEQWVPGSGGIHL